MPTIFLRQEIAAALGRDVRIIPLLVENATMPGEADLPHDIAPANVVVPGDVGEL